MLFVFSSAIAIQQVNDSTNKHTLKYSVMKSVKKYKQTFAKNPQKGIRIKMQNGDVHVLKSVSTYKEALNTIRTWFQKVAQPISIEYMNAEETKDFRKKFAISEKDKLYAKFECKLAKHSLLAAVNSASGTLYVGDLTIAFWPTKQSKSVFQVPVKNVTSITEKSKAGVHSLSIFTTDKKKHKLVVESGKHKDAYLTLHYVVD